MKLIDVRLRDAILWQYEQAKRLIGLVDLMQAGYDVTTEQFWGDWYRDVFNIDTANDFGLSVWAKILGVKTVISFDPQPAKNAFGFGVERKNFSAPTGFGSRSGGQVGLTLEQKRLVVRLRYFQLTHRPTLDNINALLKTYLWKGDNKVFVSDPQDMSIIMYTFMYQPDGGLMFLLQNMDVLPRPAGVKTGVKIVGKTSFGFGVNRANFVVPSNFGNIGVF